MIVTAPFYLLGNRYAVIHDAEWTYVIDLEHHQIHNKIKGFPVGASRDEHILITCKPVQPLNSEYSLYGINIVSNENIDVADIKRFDFPKHNNFMHRGFDIGSDSPATLILENVIKTDPLSKFQFDDKDSYLCTLTVQPQLYRALSSPILAFSGTWDYDADGYGCVWLYDIAKDRELYHISILDQAPIIMNYIAGSSQITLVACDYVQLIDIDTGEATTVIKGKPFDRHNFWTGKAQIIDALRRPTDITCVLVAEHYQWYFINQRDDGWVESTRYDVDSTIRRISIVNDNVILLTENDFRLLTLDGKLVCKIVL